jgi:hypothetical protein
MGLSTCQKKQSGAAEFEKIVALSAIGGEIMQQLLL